MCELLYLLASGTSPCADDNELGCYDLNLRYYATKIYKHTYRHTIGYRVDKLLQDIQLDQTCYLEQGVVLISQVGPRISILPLSFSFAVQLRRTRHRRRIVSVVQTNPNQ